jgi:3-oxoacyl-[acyl-carrier-protein] synthase-1
MASCVGSSAAACAAIRAGISGFSELEDYSCDAGDGGPVQPLVAAPAGAEPRSAETAIALFVAALQDLITNAGMTRRELSRVPVIVSLPETSRSAESRRLAEGIFAAAAARAGIPPAPGSGFSGHGHAGVLFAIGAAQGALSRGACSACIVAGVESYLDAETLSALDAAGRLKSGRNPDAFVPGECAVAALLEPAGGAARRGDRPFAQLAAPGFGMEERPRGSGETSTGRGLCDAVRAAVGTDARPFSWAVGDLNGEMYKAREWAEVRVRLAPWLNGLRHLWHPADCIGDVGAATGGVLLAIAARALDKGYAPADRALVFAGSDDGTRAAVVVSAGGM